MAQKQKEKDIIIDGILARYDKKGTRSLDFAEFQQFVKDTFRNSGKPGKRLAVEESTAQMFFAMCDADENGKLDR